MVLQEGGPALSRDLQRQNSRQPARCQRTIVFGRTTITHDRQSHNRESQARLKRVAASMRRGFTPRSLKSASCRRKTRFSASIDRRDLAVNTSKPIKSPSRRRTMQAKAITPTSCHGFYDQYSVRIPGSGFCGGQRRTLRNRPHRIHLSGRPRWKIFGIFPPGTPPDRMVEIIRQHLPQ